MIKLFADPTLSSLNKENEFTWKGLSFQQYPDVFKIGTDSLLLCEWAKKKLIAPRNILDVGGGSGILTGVLGKHFPDAHMTVIENDPQSASACRRNLQSLLGDNGWEVFEDDFFQWDHASETFDVIISNPPYFIGGSHLPSAKFDNARASIVDPHHWMMTMKRFLTQEGIILIVIPEDSAFEWIRVAGECGSYCHHRLNVFSFKGDQKAKRVMLSFRNHLVRPEIMEVCIYEDENKYSEPYKILMGL